MLQVVPATDVAAVENEDLSFANFWLLYPKRVSRLEAEKAWRRLSDVQRVAALTGLIQWRAIWLASHDLTFVPHASTWIHQQRWEDELPEKWGSGHASHVAANLPEQGKRVAMPESVRSALAKLRPK